MSANRTYNAQSGTPFVNTGFGPLLGHMAGLVSDWRERAAQRRRLSKMDDRLLKDIGLTDAEAYGEYSKPFWKR